MAYNRKPWCGAQWNDLCFSKIIVVTVKMSCKKQSAVIVVGGTDSEAVKTEKKETDQRERAKDMLVNAV